MPTRCDHDQSEKRKNSRDEEVCRACDRERYHRRNGRTAPLVQRLDPLADTKRCRKCDVVKPVERFYRNSRSSDGLVHICKECWKGYYQPDRHRDTFLQRRYGITLAEYAGLLEEQDGCCWICGALPESQDHGVLAVDHDHVTGQVRGLLCGSCNNGLGRFKDSIELLEAAISYLRKG